MVTIEIVTKARQEIVNITPQLLEAVTKEGWRNGLCVVFTPHSTTAITINENEDPNVLRDLLFAYERIAPSEDSNYTHVEKNMAAHIKASVVGSSQSLIISNGEWQRGKYQDVYFCEFDGPRTRKVVFQFVGGK